MLISRGVTNQKWMIFPVETFPSIMSNIMDGPGWLRPVSKATTLALQTAKIKV